MTNVPEEQALETELNSAPLVAYRLGRVEKAMEGLREDIKKLTELKSDVIKNDLRITKLEQAQTGLYKFLTGLTIAVGATIADAVVRSMQ